MNNVHHSDKIHHSDKFITLMKFHKNFINIPLIVSFFQTLMNVYLSDEYSSQRIMFITLVEFNTLIIFITLMKLHKNNINIILINFIQLMNSHQRNEPFITLQSQLWFFIKVAYFHQSIDFDHNVEFSSHWWIFITVWFCILTISFSCSDEFSSKW